VRTRKQKRRAPTQDTQAKSASNDFVTDAADAVIDLSRLLRACMRAAILNVLRLAWNFRRAIL
jgi:post-segregation antitoxin (ccd killing protein)